MPPQLPQHVPNWSIPNAISLGTQILEPRSRPLRHGESPSCSPSRGCRRACCSVLADQGRGGTLRNPGIAAVTSAARPGSPSRHRVHGEPQACSPSAAQEHLIVMPDADASDGDKSWLDAWCGSNGSCPLVMVAVSTTAPIIAHDRARTRIVPVRDVP